MEFAIAIWIMCGIVSAVIASNKGRNACGWCILGFLIGPFGILLSAVMSTDQEKLDQEAIRKGVKKRCKYCHALIPASAVKCQHCGSEVSVIVEESINQAL